MKISNKLFSFLLVMAMVIGLLPVISSSAEGAETENNLPVFSEFVSEEGKIGGLYVSETDREYNSYGGGTRAVVDLKFPAPWELEADSYTLQFSADNGFSWENYQHYYEDLTTTGDNFSLNLEENYMLRLLVHGGPKDGYTSNAVEAPLSNVDTTFSGWGLDESMFLTGVIAPYVGRGLEASFSVNKLDVDYTVVEGFLTYQWYRVNPATYEMTEILGATNLNYTTTLADAGYLLLIRATGDGVNVGGYIQTFAQWKTVIPNNAFVNNVTNNGFTLNLDKTVDSLTVSDLTLRDKDWNLVQIDSVTPGENQATFNISATITSDSYPLRLNNNSDFWCIVSSVAGGHMMMEGVEVAEDTTYTATPIVQIGINPNDGESAGIFVGIKDVKNAQGDDVPDAKLAGYHIDLVYDHNQTKVLDVVDEAHLGNFIFNNNETDTIMVSVADIVYQGTSNFEKLFFVPIALTGTSNNTTNVTIKFTSLCDLNLNHIIIPDITLPFQRGKILNEANNETLSIVDAVAGLQYLAKIVDSGTDTGKVNVINMASIIPPETGVTGIKPSVKNVIALMQKVVGLRDGTFQLVSGA